MSETLFEHNGITVTQYTGTQNAFLPETDRRRFAIRNNVDRSCVTLSFDQWRTLGEYFMADCGPDCEGPRLTQPIPDTWRWFDDRAGSDPAQR